MGVFLPQSTDKQNSPSHSFLHRVIAVFENAPEQSVLVKEDGSIKLHTYEGILVGSAGNISVITNNSAKWDIAYSHSQLSSGNPHSVSKSDVGLGNVENTALSTWAGTTNITTLGTISVGTWQGGIIDHERGGLESDVSGYSGLLKISAGATSQITDNSTNWNTAYGWGNHASVGYVKADGSVALTANWDVGAYTLTALQFISDIVIGTAPLVITSTTKVANLNVDRLDDQEGSYYLDSANFTGTSWGDLTDGGASTLHKHDHGNMDGLGDDDHTQYILVDGSRAFSGVVGGITPTDGAHLVTKDYVDSKIQGLDWQESVIDRFDPTSATPVGPSTGDRYISTATANGWTINYIYEYQGSWQETISDEGFATWVEDEDVVYVYNGSSWVKFGSTITHNNTSGKQGGTTNEYYHFTSAQHSNLILFGTETGYLLRDGSRNLTANWDAGSWKITAEQFESDIATGTAPLIVASSTKVSSLNADLLDSQHGAYYLDSDNFTGTEWTDLTDGGNTLLHIHDSRYYTETEIGATETPTGASLVGFDSTLLLLDGDNVQDVIEELDNKFAEARKPTGFLQTADSLAPVDSILTWSDSLPDRTLTIAPTTVDFSFYVRGQKYTKTSSDSVQIADSEGLHYIYYDTDGILKESESESFANETIIPFRALVAIIYWDFTNQVAIYFGEERHMNNMSGTAHIYHHLIDGTRFISGSAVEDILTDESGALDSHAQFGLATGEIRDEDLATRSSAVPSTTGLSIFYKDGANGYWRRQVETGFSVLTTGTGRLAWNEFTGGAWQLSEVGNTNYVLCHIFHTNDNNISDGYIAIVGQGEYTNIINAREGATTEINNLITTGLPFVEFTPIATIIFQTNNNYNSGVKGRTRTTDDGSDWIDWRTSEISPVASSISSHLLLANLNDGDGVGNHTNAFNLLGRSGGQTAIGGLLTAEDLTFQDNVIDGNTITVSQMIAAYTHIGESGASHTYIDQSVVSGASPTFDGSNFTGIPDGALNSTFLKNVVEDTTPQLGGTLDGLENQIDNIGNITHHFATPTDWILKNQDEDKDITLNVNVGGTPTDILKICGANGFIGMGINSPLAQLHVSSDGLAVSSSLLATEEFIISREDQATGINMIVSSDVSKRGVYKGTRSRGDLDAPTACGDGDEILSFLGNFYDGTQVGATGEIKFRVDGAVSDGVRPQKIEFYTSETTGRTLRMTIRGNGDIAIGNFTPAFLLDVDGTFGVQGLSGGAIGANPTVWYNTGTGELNYDTSAEKYKENIEDLGDTSWLYALKPRTFDEKDGTRTGLIGLIAEEVELVKPELVFKKPLMKIIQVEENVLDENGDTTYDEEKNPITQLVDKEVKDLENWEIEGVNSHQLIVPMLKEIQNQKKEIDNLNSRIKFFEKL